MSEEEHRKFIASALKSLMLSDNLGDVCEDIKKIARVYGIEDVDISMNPNRSHKEQFEVFDDISGGKSVWDYDKGELKHE